MFNVTTNTYTKYCFETIHINKSSNYQCNNVYLYQRGQKVRVAGQRARVAARLELPRQVRHGERESCMREAGCMHGHMAAVGAF